MTMSSSSFIDTLRHIGYPKADILDPLALDWAYELEATLPFLKWFCSCVTEDNFVSTADINEFKLLSDSQGAITGVHLEESLSALREFKILPEDESIHSEVNSLKESLAKAKVQKSTLKARCNKLSIHHMALCNRITKMEEAEALESNVYRRMMEACGSQNEKIATTLDSLAESVEKLISLIHIPSMGKENDHNDDSPPFLSQCNLTAYCKAENDYSHDLTTFTKKQFFEGMAEMTGGKELHYNLMDVSLPEAASPTGDSTFLQDCQEFSRLQQIFPKSECHRINAFVGASKAVSAVNEARTILHVLKSNQFPTSAAEISRFHHKVEEKIEAARNEASSLKTPLLDLIRELGGLQGTEILTGDYDLKLQRQNYFIRKQDNVIDQLITQRARHEFLVMLYELESRCHRETHHLLSAARQVLESILKDWQQRMKDLEDPDLNVKRLERNVVDTRDQSSSRLYSLLAQDSPDDDKLMYLPKEKIAEKALMLGKQWNNAKSADKTMDEKYLSKVSELESCVEDCISTLYIGSSISSGQPSHSPPEIQSAVAELTSAIVKLEVELAGLVTDVNNKKMALKNNLLLSKERELFTLFHTDPARLQYVVNGLADRLKAQDIQ